MICLVKHVLFSEAKRYRSTVDREQKSEYPKTDPCMRNFPDLWALLHLQNTPLNLPASPIMSIFQFTFTNPPS